MSFGKPFRRNYRGIKPAPNSGYSDWGYIRDRSYAKDPEHYVRACILIQNDLKEIFEFIEPSAEAASAYSYRIHALLMRTCIEVEANFRAIFEENKFTPPKNRSISMRDYRKIEATHHLSSYEVMLPIWNGTPPILQPFHEWKASDSASSSPPWYRAYNISKHSRHDGFKEANLGNLVEAVAGLLVLISSQFKTEEFTAGDEALGISGYDYYPMSSSIGSLFRIKFPDDWADAEMYDFDWSELSKEDNRFATIDFDAIP